MNDDTTAVAERGTGSKKIQGHIVIAQTEDPNAKWYVVHTSSGHEVRVMDTLRQRIETMNLVGRVFEMLVPTQDKIIIRNVQFFQNSLKFIRIFFNIILDRHIFCFSRLNIFKRIIIASCYKAYIITQ